MAECTHCQFCEDGSLEKSPEVARVPAIVRERLDESFTVWRCGSCRSLHSKEAVDLDAYYGIYPFARHQLDYWTRKTCENRLRELERQGVGRGDAVLDYGCGTGIFVEFLKASGFSDVTGYDAYIGRYAGREALERRYDAVLAQDVLEHAEDPAAMFADLVRCLRPGGLLYIGTPLADTIRLKRHPHYAMSLHQPYHRHILSRQALTGLARRNGLGPSGFSSRHCTDTKAPAVNTRFLHEFVRRSGNVVNAAFEPPRAELFLKHPSLLFFAFAGYYASRRCEMSAYFRSGAEAV